MCKIETFNVTIPYTGLNRRVWVYLPSEYATSGKNYPVLYMHDGQNIFDESTSFKGSIWDVHSSIEKAIIKKKTEGVIVVALDNANVEEGHEDVCRFDEYCPWMNTKLKTLQFNRGINRDLGGYGSEYGKFLVEVIKPLIDQKYRTYKDRNNTGIAGSGMGAYISLYIGLKYDDVFSKVGAFSTALWFAKKELLELIQSHAPDRPTKWYLDIGTNESNSYDMSDFSQLYIKGTMEIYENLLQVGVKEKNLKIVIDEGAKHEEEAWANRFPAAFDWLFCKE